MPEDVELNNLKAAKEGYEASIKHLEATSAKDGVDRSKAIAEEKAVVAKFATLISNYGKAKPI